MILPSNELDRLAPHLLERWEEARLLEVLDSDADVEMRRAAAVELSRLGCEEAVPILIKALHSVDLGDSKPLISPSIFSGSGFRFQPQHWSRSAGCSSGWEHNWPGQALVTYGADVFVEIAEATTTVEPEPVTSGIRFNAPDPFPDEEIESLRPLMQTLVHFDPTVIARVVRGPAPQRARTHAIGVLATLEEVNEKQIDALEHAARSDDPEILLAVARAVCFASPPVLERVSETLARRAIEVDFGDDRFKDIPGDVLITLGPLERPGPNAIALARKYSVSPYQSLAEWCDRVLSRVEISER